MSDPVTYVVNGYAYLSQPQCPYDKARQFVLRWVWSLGAHDGLRQRLTKTF